MQPSLGVGKDGNSTLNKVLADMSVGIPISKVRSMTVASVEVIIALAEVLIITPMGLLLKLSNSEGKIKKSLLLATMFTLHLTYRMA